MDGEEWGAIAAGQKWTPAEIKAFEMGQVEPAKQELKGVKEGIGRLEREIQGTCEQLEQVVGRCERAGQEGLELVSQIKDLNEQIQALESSQAPFAQVQQTTAITYLLSSIDQGKS